MEGNLALPVVPKRAKSFFFFFVLFCASWRVKRNGHAGSNLQKEGTKTLTKDTYIHAHKNGEKNAASCENVFFFFYRRFFPVDDENMLLFVILISHDRLSVLANLVSAHSLKKSREEWTRAFFRPRLSFCFYPSFPQLLPFYPPPPPHKKKGFFSPHVELVVFSFVDNLFHNHYIPHSEVFFSSSFFFLIYIFIK